MDYRKRRTEQAPIHVDGAEVEWVEIFKYLGVQTIMVQTHQESNEDGLFPLRRLKRFGMGPQIRSYTAASSRAS